MQALAFNIPQITSAVNFEHILRRHLGPSQYKDVVLQV